MGVGVDVELPPPQLIVPNAHASSISIMSRRHFRVRKPSSQRFASRTMTPARIVHSELPNPVKIPAADVLAAVVAIATVKGTEAVLVMLAGAGLNEHVDLEGRPEHVKLTAPVNPLSGVAPRP